MSQSSSRQTARFIVAAVVLALSAGGVHLAQARGWLLNIKQALPIQKPLSDLDRACVSPLIFRSSERVESEMANELGTEEYLNWILDIPPDKKTLRAPVSFSVSYYTGKPDQIPHVPEECMWQGGLSSTGDDDKLQWPISGSNEKISVRRLGFFPKAVDGTKYWVYYTICVNGDFFASREPGAKLRMSSRTDTHLYYSKVDLMFRGVRDADRPVVDKMAEAVMTGAVAELLRAHYPPKGWAKGGPPPQGAAVKAGS